MPIILKSYGGRETLRLNRKCEGKTFQIESGGCTVARLSAKWDLPA